MFYAVEVKHRAVQKVWYKLTCNFVFLRLAWGVLSVLVPMHVRSQNIGQPCTGSILFRQSYSNLHTTSSTQHIAYDIFMSNAWHPTEASCGYFCNIKLLYIIVQPNVVQDNEMFSVCKTVRYVIMLYYQMLYYQIHDHVLQNFLPHNAAIKNQCCIAWYTIVYYSLQH